MKKIRFAFGIHCHQPVGNFDFVFEKVFRRAYQPFLEVISKYTQFKINLHFSGILLDWIDKKYPKYIEKLAGMAANRQVEMLSGGFYEPILSVIPEKDGIGQINKLNQWIQNRLHTTPQGMWLAERVWEPTLPSIMQNSGIDYTVIDDAHFKFCGLHSGDLLGYYLTENVGDSVALFPISMKLRYTIPFEEPEVTLEYLRSLASENEDRLVVFADDGEKFGEWPDTHDLVYKTKWLERFIRLILDNSDWIEMMHFSEALDTLKPYGRIYLPTASYSEMMQWALPAKAYQEYEDFENYLKDQKIYDEVNTFVRGGFWRNFLVKYPESNRMHKKMLYLSRKAWQIKEREDTQLVDQALDHIWAGQCNCAYWHGVFGGIYLGHIRHANYANFIKAEKILRQVVKVEHSTDIIQTDYNTDGQDELLVETPRLNLYIEPEKGARICELDYLPANYNMLNNLSRREEGYHRKLYEMPDNKEATSQAASKENVASIHNRVESKEAGLEQYLNYDMYERKSLIDHFLSDDTSIEDFNKSQFREMGDFVNRSYQVVNVFDADSTINLEFVCNGHICHKDDSIPLQLKKSIHIYKDKTAFEVKYKLSSEQPITFPLWFAVELNFGILAGHAEDRYYFSGETDIQPANLASQGELQNVSHLGLADEFYGVSISLESSKSARIWRLPIETVSLSEEGFERVFQGSSVLFSYPLELNPAWEVKISKIIRSI